MNGMVLKEKTRQILLESEDGTFLTDFMFFHALNEAATEFNQRTNWLRSYQDITTVASQSEYTLEADFLKLYLANDNNQFIVRYDDGTNKVFIPWKDYDSIFILDQENYPADIPSSFTIIDHPTLSSAVTGTVTSAGSDSNGECVLTDASADFSTIVVGDTVANLTDRSSGVVLGTGTTTLTVSLFSGTNNAWELGDSYLVQPQGRKQLILDPPPETGGETVRVPYVVVPGPVFSPIRSFRFPNEVLEVLPYRIAWAFKYKDQEPNFGDRYYQIFDVEVRRYSRLVKNTRRPNTIKVKFKR